MSEMVKLARDREVLVITISNPPVNALSPGVPDGIMNGIRAGERDGAVKAIVLIGGGRTFIAGADIREFGKITSGGGKMEMRFHPLMNVLEACAKPVVCAIHGTAFGGGLEVAMACHYRIAVPSAQVGQPEVKLGLIPGAGGTQRLPRLAGIQKSVEMCTTGGPIGASEALMWGIVDRLADGDLLSGAVDYARELLALSGPVRRTRDLVEKLGDEAANSIIFASAREEVRRRHRGRVAPLKAIDAIEAATRLPFDQGIEKESELFESCLFSDESKALIHVFFGEREVSKIPGITMETPSIAVRKAAVIGAGTMGSGIAMACANAGIPVILKDVSTEALDRGLAKIRKNYEASVGRGRFTREAAEQRMALILPNIGYERIAEADIVVETVYEDMELKCRIFHELDRVCWPEAILASNTSSLDIDRLAAATSRPFKVVGLHFFVPPHVMRLIEIVRGKSTAPEVIAASFALAKKLGKTGVLVGNCRGFAGNRMYEKYQREAQFLIEEGASIHGVDTALCNFGMAMGPFATEDLSGLDVGFRMRKESGDSAISGRRPQVADRLCELGRFGQKTGTGWYRYGPDDRTPIPDPEVEKTVEEMARSAGILRRAVSAEEIVERAVYALVNEGARILEERIAYRAADLDILCIYGYGFPARRGGPMWFADAVGLPRILERVSELRRLYGEHWKPAPLLERLAREGKSFADFDRSVF